MGLASLFLGDQNPFSQFVADNRNTIRGIGTGFAQGTDFGTGLASAAYGAAQGGMQDDTLREKSAKEKLAIDYLQSTDPEMAQLVKAGMDPNAAFVALLKKQQEGTGADVPANVREWEYFNKLSPEDQGAYLRMKRSNPYLDIGTGFVQPDPVNPGSVAGPAIGKENYQEAFDTASGGAAGKVNAEAAFEAPAAVASAENSIAQIDAVLNDPNLKYAVGLGGLLPAVPNTPQAGTVARIEQLQGAAFLQAFETLKGGGQITEVEGKKATDAIARLNRAQNETDFKTALNDLKSVIQVGLTRAKSRLSGGSQQTSTGVQWSYEP